jgi:hypothetical protein
MLLDLGKTAMTQAGVGRSAVGAWVVRKRLPVFGRQFIVRCQRLRGKADRFGAGGQRVDLLGSACANWLDDRSCLD